MTSAPPDTSHKPFLPKPGETYIRVFDGVVPPSYCQQLITLFHGCAQKHEGVAQAGGYAVPEGHKICDEVHIKEVYLEEKRQDVLAMWKRVDEQLFGFVDPLLAGYIREFGVLSGQPIRDEGFRFKRYPKGVGKFGMHVDMTPETPTRTMAILVYLNTVTQGGETVFPWQGVAVKPVVGRVCIAPTYWTYPHQSSIPISHDKYIVNNFAMF